MNSNNQGNSDNAPGHNKSYNVILNGTPIIVFEDHLAYEQIVQLAYPSDPQGNPDLLYTVTYANPNGRDGTLAAGQKLTIKDGVSINVRKTNRS
ncbi:MAG: multiubiquitin domain-containing protein [Zoogloeaceae bacterium]|jgi:hypothetical protein|nr:multiubiquitin domain-containing protein [Zoogloeaceae bacterium]